MGKNLIGRTKLSFTTIFLVVQKVLRARAAFQNGRTKNLDFREAQLQNLLRMYQENEKRFLDALAEDLRKPRFEGIVMETDMLINDVRHMLNEFREWAKPIKVHLELGLSSFYDHDHCLLL